MRQLYYPTAASHQLYRAAINNDLGVYSVQSGSGLGGFLKGLLKRVVPMGKSLLKQGFEAAKPMLRDLASQGISEAQKYAEKQIKVGADKMQTKVQTKLGKRKKDHLS